MSLRPGKACKVVLGSSKVVAMGTWSIDGITADEMESSAFDQNWKTYEFGMKDGGTISFNGFFDPDDTTGQQALMNANLENTNLTTIKLYVDSTSYFEPCQTTGYFSPTTTQNADTSASHVNVTSFNIGADKSGICTIDFTCKVSGVMVLV